MRFLLIFLLTLIPALTFAQGVLKIDMILNRPDAGGMLHIAVCPSAEAYKTETGCATRSVKADAKIVSCTFYDLSPGTYAVKVFHDVNGDGVLDKSWVGWPKEPYGFSNDAPVNMGPPSFRSAAITVKAGEQTARIRLR